jgi:hypothetical protein
MCCNGGRGTAPGCWEKARLWVGTLLIPEGAQASRASISAFRGDLGEAARVLTGSSQH